MKARLEWPLDDGPSVIFAPTPIPAICRRPPCAVIATAACWRRVIHCLCVCHFLGMVILPVSGCKLPLRVCADGHGLAGKLVGKPCFGKPHHKLGLHQPYRV